MPKVDYRLRPIREGDLETVLAWRNSEPVRSNMYSDHIISTAEHEAWFQSFQTAEFPPVLVFEYRDLPVGITSFSQIDRRNNKCSWGFYLGENDLPRGSGTIMGFLAQSYIFEEKGFRKLCAEAFAFNDASISYHKRLGFKEEGRFVKHVLKNTLYEDVISFAIFVHDWLAMKHQLEKLCYGDRDE